MSRLRVCRTNRLGSAQIHHQDVTGLCSSWTHACSATTMRSCDGSMVRSAIEKGILYDLIGKCIVPPEGSCAEGKGINRIDVGCHTIQSRLLLG